MLVGIIVRSGVAQRSAASPASSDTPRYSGSGELMKPENYREWVWLSSGIGMNYGPVAATMQNATPPFDNVFVNPEAYRAFLRTGTWPDQTMLVLEIRGSETKGSINKGGHFQGNLFGIEVEVKDEKKFPGKWAFFTFGRAAKTGQLRPASESCYSCHAQNAAVDNTFVQFYPTLIDIAKQKGTFKNTE
ncbi:MAG: cytochrome P460 [Acidobacteria bacterium]|nr:cytochrome P460 [Acidobacteriota bacterium]